MSVIAPPTGLPRLLAPDAASLDDHTRRLGTMPGIGAGLIGEIERAGLRGRGGASFPTAVKLMAVAAGRRPVVVVNATEGEPTSRKDKVLLLAAPHVVLDGAYLAAAAVGADDVIVCVERSQTRVMHAVQRALAERAAADEAGGITMRLAGATDRYVGGEESALVHWLNGGEAKPVFVPPRPFERGVGGRPTLVDNAETLGHIALIGRFGAEWFRSVGTAPDPGSALVTLAGAIPKPGVVEIALGMPLAEVIARSDSSMADVQAVLIGGYFGCWLPGAVAAEVAMSPDGLAAVGGSMGCGVVGVLPMGVCGLAESARITRWLAEQNAGQCGPCVNGLMSIASAMDALVGGDHDGRAQTAITRWSGMITGRGACKHPDGTVRFVESSLRVFNDEIARHRRHGPCAHAVPVFPTPPTGGWR